MKVLALSPVYPPTRGGIQALVSGLMRHWPRARTLLVTTGTNDVARYPGAEAVVRVRPSRLGHRTTVLKLNLKALIVAWRSAPDVVLCLHVVLSPAALILDCFGVPFVLYVHGTEARRRGLLTSLAAKRARRVVAGSRYAVDLAISAGAGPDKCHWIEPGIDPSPPRQVARSSDPTLITVSRLEDRHKGHDVMMEVVSLLKPRFPGLLWIIVGDGALRGELEYRAREAGIQDCIEFVGSVADADRDRCMDRAWVFAMPSRIEPGGNVEGYGLVYLEAGAHELPVVAGNVGGALDAVADGVTGLLVDPTDIHDVAGAVRRLLQDEEMRSQLGSEGLRKARGQTWDLFTTRVEAVLEEAIS